MGLRWKSFIYDKLSLFDRRNVFYDLYKYDLESQKSQRLTQGERAKEPGLSPCGQKVAYIKTRPGGTALYLLQRSDNSSHKLYKPPLQIRLSQPEFINKNEILFAERSLSGEEKFYIYNLNEHIKHPVLENFEPLGHPRKQAKVSCFPQTNPVYPTSTSPPSMILTKPGP